MPQVITSTGARRTVLAIVTAIAALMAFAAAGHAATDPCAAPVTNPVACENSKPGVPLTDWRTIGNGDPTIQGYATQMSVNKGQTIQFKIKTPSTNYHIDILRLGYYDGDGARMIAGEHPADGEPAADPAGVHHGLRRPG